MALAERRGGMARNSELIAIGQEIRVGGTRNQVPEFSYMSSADYIATQFTTRAELEQAAADFAEVKPLSEDNIPLLSALMERDHGLYLAAATQRYDRARYYNGGRSNKE